jgi:hypothetical protein
MASPGDPGLFCVVSFISSDDRRTTKIDLKNLGNWERIRREEWKFCGKARRFCAKITSSVNKNTRVCGNLAARKISQEKNLQPQTFAVE